MLLSFTIDVKIGKKEFLSKYYIKFMPLAYGVFIAILLLS